MIVFDLDGTIALDHHRSHLLKGDVKYWDEYFNACTHDELNVPIFRMLESIYYTKQASIAIWSGRSMKVWDQTTEWLAKHGISEMLSDIRLRHEDDRTQDDILKRQWLHNLREQGQDVTLVFEDRQRVVDMWRSEGIVCCQVAPGNF